MSTCPGAGGAPAGIPVDAAPPERVIEQLQRLADCAVRSRGRGGHLIARIESADGSWCWETVATGADAAAAPVRPSTPFHLASLTKMYTAALVLRLAAYGRLALTDPVTAHLPAELTDRLHVPAQRAVSAAAGVLAWGRMPGSCARILPGGSCPRGVGCVSSRSRLVFPGRQVWLLVPAFGGGRVACDVTGKGAGGGRGQGPTAAFHADCFPWSARRRAGCLRFGPAGDAALRHAVG